MGKVNISISIEATDDEVKALTTTVFKAATPGGCNIKDILLFMQAKKGQCSYVSVATSQNVDNYYGLSNTPIPRKGPFTLDVSIKN